MTNKLEDRKAVTAFAYSAKTQTLNFEGAVQLTFPSAIQAIYRGAIVFFHALVPQAEKIIAASVA